MSRILRRLLAGLLGRRAGETPTIDPSESRAAVVDSDGGAPRAAEDGREGGEWHPAPTAWNRSLTELSPPDLLEALHHGWGLPVVVPRALDLVARDPLASAGGAPGDLLRALMSVPASFWGRHSRLYARYQEALRAGALARRRLPPEQRLDFWLYEPRIHSAPARSTPSPRPSIRSSS